MYKIRSNKQVEKVGDKFKFKPTLWQWIFGYSPMGNWALLEHGHFNVVNLKVKVPAGTEYSHAPWGIFASAYEVIEIINTDN